MNRPSDPLKSFESRSPSSTGGTLDRVAAVTTPLIYKKGYNAMEYCGVKYIAVQASTEPFWKWRILHTKKSSGTLSGEACDQTTAIARAHEAIGLSLRAERQSDVERHLPHFADQALHILHGARELPTTMAVEALRPFIEIMSYRTSPNHQLGDASAIAINRLIDSLTLKHTASDDIWQSAIDSTLSFANEMSGSSALAT